MKRAIPEEFFDTSIPYSKQEKAIKKAENFCAEFGTLRRIPGEDALHKEGFEALESSCAACKGKLACLFMGQKSRGYQVTINAIKKHLGIEHFYDENRIYELSRFIIDKLYKAIQSEGRVPLQEIKEDLDYAATGPHHNDDTLYLRTNDPKVPKYMLEALLNKPHLTIEKFRGEDHIVYAKPE